MTEINAKKCEWNGRENAFIITLIIITPNGERVMKRDVSNFGWRFNRRSFLSQPERWNYECILLLVKHPFISRPIWTHSRTFCNRGFKKTLLPSIWIVLSFCMYVSEGSKYTICTCFVLFFHEVKWESLGYSLLLFNHHHQILHI